ncbi:MAG: hypothetical protein AB7V22_11075 [Kiritimatiellia bacterium]
MGARCFRPKRLLTLALLALAVAVSAWWLVHVPYDPLAIYRPVPASATLVGRHVRLPARWRELLANPLALALMRTAGVRTEEAAALVDDPESLAWFEKLAGREGTLAYLPGRFGRHPAWMAVSQLGGQSQKLRWQLSAFRVPGFERMRAFPGRSVWRVDVPDLEPGQHLVVTFGEGVLMACVSADPLAIEEVLAAYDGRGQRLLEREPAFAIFAQQDDRTLPDRFWFRDESAYAAPREPGVAVDVPVLRADAMRLAATTKGAELVPEDRASAVDLASLAARLGAAPCLAATVRRDALLQIWNRSDLTRDARHALRMVLDVATADRLALIAMDGDLGGRLTFGVMRLLGAGVRVPTLMLATPAPDPAAAQAAIQRVLDASNARYRAAFVLKPMVLPAATIYVLESAGRDEWVDELPLADRPAYAVLDGWLLASSNLGALQKLAEAPVRADAAAPAWVRPLERPGAVAAWLDLVRSGKAAKGAIATWSIAQVAFGGDAEIGRRLNEAKVWIEAFEPFGEARAELGRRDGATALALDLGLSGAAAPE